MGLEDLLSQSRIVVLDGGFATHLEDVLRLDINSGFTWASNLLDDKARRGGPRAIYQTHLDFLQAGAQIIGTATYQASSFGFEQAGYSLERAKELMRSAVALAVEARDDYVRDCTPSLAGKEEPLIALSLGPFGAVLQNGSEYTGEYHTLASPSEHLADEDLSVFQEAHPVTYDELVSFHSTRLDVFASDEATWNSIDLLAFETLPRLDEARAILEALRGLRRRTGRMPKEAYLSFSAPDGTGLPWRPRTGGGQEDDLEEEERSFLTLARTVLAPHPDCTISGIGFNCTKPYYLEELVRRLNKALRHLVETEDLNKARRKAGAREPLLVLYPDGGLVWNAKTKTWLSASTPGNGAASTAPPKIDLATEVLNAASPAHPRPLCPNSTRTWAGVLAGGCCKARTQDIKRLRDIKRDLDAQPCEQTDMH